MGVPQECADTQHTHVVAPAGQPAQPSVPYLHHHDGHVVCRAPLHCLVGQPVARSLVAGIYSGFPFPGLNLLILPKEKGPKWMVSTLTDLRTHHAQGAHAVWGPAAGAGH